MKTWVFNEAMLRYALAAWKTATCSPGERREAAEPSIEAFLHSDEAAKLRVKQLEQPNAGASPQR